ncbi:uncharacterized protein LOC129731962 [Wyeomyia smithii]|uniref:uncharacterized protein LOC129731962 n=1 Tax=Wyeomyia smithii TaxID=174621 RepID=UPI0024681BCA|nr:uncharacterized protein LOC129731962 [Wyeomyia smithii]
MDFEANAKLGVTENSVWFYYLRGKQNREIAKCIRCSKVIKCEGSSTSGLKTHLKGQHNIDLTLKKHAASCDIRPSKSATSSKNSNIMQYFSNVSQLEIVLARMAAKDCISFRTIARSEDIRQGLLARGFTGIPKTHDGVRQKVKSYHEFVIQEYRKQFDEIKKEHRKISLTFDEWTSNRNRRYMNINVHASKQTWNLELRRIFGSMTADNCLSLPNQHLNELNLSLSDDVMAVTTDGPHIMLKVGILLNATHQVCLAHGIHLAVIGVLYRKKSEDAEFFLKSDGSDDDHDSDAVESQFFATETDGGASPILKPQISEIVKKVRTVISFSTVTSKKRHSPKLCPL